jgi:hypothetical protein
VTGGIGIQTNPQELAAAEKSEGHVAAVKRVQFHLHGERRSQKAAEPQENKQQIQEAVELQEEENKLPLQAGIAAGVQTDRVKEFLENSATREEESFDYPGRKPRKVAGTQQLVRLDSWECGFFDIKGVC